jgi:hypothetical protein
VHRGRGTVPCNELRIFVYALHSQR